VKLTTRLTIAAIAPAFLVTAVGISGAWFFKRQVMNLALSVCCEHTRALVNELDHLVGDRLDDWSGYLNTAAVRRAVAESNRQFEKRIGRERWIDRVEAEWRQGSEPAELRAKVTGCDLARDLRLRLAGLGQWRAAEVIVTNRYGATVAATGRTSHYRHSDELWWQKAWAEGTYVAPVEYDDSAGVYRLPVALRIEDLEGNPIGVAKVVFDLSGMLGLVDRMARTFRTAGVSRLWVIGPGGKLIHEGGEPFSAPRPLPAYLARAINAAAAPASGSTLATEPGSGKRVILAWATSPGRGTRSRTGWTVAAQLDLDRLVASIGSAMRSILLAAGAVTLLVLVGAGYEAYMLSRRIRTLVEAAEQIGRGKLDLSLPDSGKDELAQITRAFNSMAEGLRRADADRRRAQEMLIDTARQAGMAEVANGVLHNVGNVLNSVNVAASIMKERHKNCPATRIRKLASLLEEHKDHLEQFLTQDERGKKVPQFIIQLADAVDANRCEASKELERLQAAVEHIGEIVQLQQSYSSLGGAKQELNLAELVEEAVKLNDASFLRHNIRVVREYADVPPVLAERHKVLQILVNLISNAKRALADANRDDRQVVLRTRREGDWAVVEIEDNGVGIKPEHLPHIFEYGFTTRSDGHGFGLHMSAVNAGELGGSLTAHSDGPGKGATFILRLPIGSDGRQAATQREEIAAGI